MPSGQYERKNLFTYTVYNRRTDFPVIISGTAKECAAAMGITLGSFKSTYSRQQNGNKRASRKWEIVRDNPGDMEVEE